MKRHFLLNRHRPTPAFAHMFSGEPLSQVVAQACRTFWEFKQWVVDQQEGSMAHDGSVTKLSSYVVNYLKYLVSDFYNPIMDKVLKIEQSWRGQVRAEESGLANGVLLFMQALERQIEGRSNEYSDPALRHIFLMNNLWYMRTRSKKCELGPLLGEQWLSEQRRKVCTVTLLLVCFFLREIAG